jgi:hypothetical protein
MGRADHDQGEAGQGPARRRRWPRAVLWLALCLVLAGPVALGGIWLRLGLSPLRLPDAVTAEVAARLDAAMTANGVTLEAIELARHEPGRLDLRLVGIRLTDRDRDGALRAAFPEVTATLSTAALVRGRLHPVGVSLSDAGLRLSRDAEGRIDLALMAGEGAEAIALSETLARLDRMFASPVFADLEGVKATGLTLDMADAMTGQILRVREARMQLDRTEAGLTVTLGGALEGSRDATLDIALSRISASGQTDVAIVFDNLAARDVATVGPALAWLDLMRAPISGQIGGVLGDDGSLGDLRALLEIGPGQVRPADGALPLPFDRMASTIRYEAATRRVWFDSLSLEAPGLSLEAEGQADAAPDGTSYTAQFRLRDMRAALPELYPQGLALDRAMVDLRLALAPALRVEIGQAVIEDGDLRLSARGEVLAVEGGVAVALDAHLPGGNLREILPYWPEALAGRTRGWIEERLLEGQVSGVDVALRARPGAMPDYEMSLDFEGVRLLALPEMPPIEGGAGYLRLRGAEFVLRLDEGQMWREGGLAVALDGSRMHIADTRQRGAEAVFDLSLAGELQDLLSILTRPPVRLFQNGTMTPERIGTGGVVAEARIETRLMRQEGLGDTRFAVRAEVGGLVSDGLVPGRRLSAERLAVTVDPEGIAVSGAAEFDGVPLNGRWTRALGPGAEAVSRVEARAMLSRARLAALGLDLPEWMLRGEAEAGIDLSLPDGAAPVLRVTSDLEGMGLALPPLGWRLEPGARGVLEAELRLGDDPAVTRLMVQGAGLDLSGRVVLAEGGGFDRLEAQRFALGDWIDVTGAVIGQGAGRPVAIRVDGGRMDLRGAPQGGGAAPGSGGGPITARLDRLQVSAGIALTGVSADLTSEGGLSGQFAGQVNGQAPITGTLVATETGPAVRIRAEDGGAVLRAAEVFRSAHGGAMELVLQATGATGTYDGTLSIDSPRLRNAPVMAELLNLISVVGLLEQLSGEGINLGEVDARFRLTPAQVILSQGTAVGPSLGLSMDGTYDLARRSLEMQGVVSPLYVVNGLIGAIFAPRREGLFGFSYRLTGQAENPQVFVNPLSILTPGVFRDIFRSPPPDLSGN